MKRETEARKLRRLARELQRKDSVYDRNGRIYAFEHAFKVVGGQLLHGARVVDVGSLVDGHGRPIC